MTEEQRMQAAARRCADLANATAIKRGANQTFEASDFYGRTALYIGVVALNAILELDELARWYDHDVNPADAGPHRMASARKHILPEPKLSPVERLARALSPDNLSAATLNGLIGQLHLKLVEVDKLDATA